MSEALEEDYHSYEHFNAFFTRVLKPEVRSMPYDLNAIACPVDGSISELGIIDDDRLIQAKGHHYDLVSLLGGNQQLASSFRHGHFFTAYLAPKDYHRIHMPVMGMLKKMIYVPGSLFSVNPRTAAGLPNLFARNERVICFFETDCGLMAMILVGAIIVASVETHWHGLVAPSKLNAVQEWDYPEDLVRLERGHEMGLFQLGSTVIVLFDENSVSWESDLKGGQEIRLGQKIGNVLLSD